jgi:hypothetical protein
MVFFHPREYTHGRKKAICWKAPIHAEHLCEAADTAHTAYLDAGTRGGGVICVWLCDEPPPVIREVKPHFRAVSGARWSIGHEPCR